MSNRLDATNCTHEAALARVAELESKLEGYATREANGMQQVAELEDELTAARNAALSEGVRSGELQSRLDDVALSLKASENLRYHANQTLANANIRINELMGRLDTLATYLSDQHGIDIVDLYIEPVVERLESK